MNETTFQGDGKVAYVPVVVNAKLTKPSNADRIRSLSDEELAEWVWGAETAGRAYGPRGKQSWLDWLRQEASE